MYRGPGAAVSRLQKGSENNAGEWRGTRKAHERIAAARAAARWLIVHNVPAGAQQLPISSHQIAAGQARLGVSQELGSVLAAGHNLHRRGSSYARLSLV